MSASPPLPVGEGRGEGSLAADALPSPASLRSATFPRGRGELAGPLITALVVVLLAALPLMINRGDVVNLLFLVFLNLALGQSWNMLGGFAGQINLGHAAFFGVGALVARSLWLSGTPFPIAFVAAGLAALAFGLLIGVPTFRLRGVYFAIGTLGITEVLRIT